MQLKISDRIQECMASMQTLNEEMQDYQNIVMLIKAVMAVSSETVPVKYNQDDYDKVIAKIRNLCAKHEIQLPEFVEWNTIELI